MHKSCIGLLAVAVTSLWPAMAGATPTEPLTLENFVRPSQECATCHLFTNPPELAGEPNISPQVWQGSLMGQSARDPVFWAAVAIGHQDAPDETIDCIRCHAPKAFLDGRGDAIEIDALTPDDLDGVTCELCHRMVDDQITPPGNARYVIDDIAIDGSVPVRGPWTYPPDNQPQHATSDDNAFTSSSAMCGVCHDVTTNRERVDENGVGLGFGFGEQRTYSEWANSAFADPQDPQAQTCQDCHMPALADVAGCDGFKLANNTHPTGGRRHDLAGANLGVLNLLQQLYGKSVGGPIEDAIFDHTREQTEELLATAASLEVTFPAEVDLQTTTELAVTVTNNTGHKLPTGYAEGRVMWVEVTVSLGEQLLFSSGRYDPETELIEDDAQVRRYEAIAEDHTDGTTLHLLRSDRWIVDNRLPPRGLTPDIQTDPVGDRYQLTGDNTWPHQDSWSYMFSALALDDPTPGVDDQAEISVRLLYLQNTPEYLDFLAEENATNAAGTELLGLFETHGRPQPMVLAQAQQTVALVGLVAPAPGTESSSGGETVGETTVDSLSSGFESSESSAGPSTTDASASESETGENNGEGCGCKAQERAPTGALLMLLVLASTRLRRPST